MERECERIDENGKRVKWNFSLNFSFTSSYAIRTFFSQFVDIYLNDLNVLCAKPINSREMYNVLLNFARLSLWRMLMINVYRVDAG